MPIYYLDTSALMKRYVPEEGSDVVRELFEGLTDSDALIISQLAILEMNSAATRLLESRQTTQREYQRMLNQFERDIDYYDFTIMPVRNELVISAIDVVREYSLRALDALHFTSATIIARLTSDNQNLVMVSADGKLLEACESYGILVLDPISDDALSRMRSLR